MPPIPTEPTDWYLVVVLPENPLPDNLAGRPVYVIAANDSSEAAQWAFDQGHVECGVVVCERFQKPEEP